MKSNYENMGFLFAYNSVFMELLRAIILFLLLDNFSLFRIRI